MNLKSTVHFKEILRRKFIPIQNYAQLNQKHEKPMVRLQLASGSDGSQVDSDGYFIEISLKFDDNTTESYHLTARAILI